jgi:polar amino acid transport system permease protein
MADPVSFINWSLLALEPPGWGGVLLRGLMNSIEIAIGGYAFGLMLGIGGACGKLYGGPITRDLMECYTTIVRAVPELVLILLLYYAGTDALNYVLALVVQGAYTTEVLRGAIKAVPAGQIEAARAYGMSPYKVMTRVTLPAMLPYAIPGLSNLWLIATKDTALLAVVGFSELTLVTRQAAGSTKAYLLFFCAAGALYLMLTLVSDVIIRIIERRARRGFVEQS